MQCLQLPEAGTSASISGLRQSKAQKELTPQSGTCPEPRSGPTERIKQKAQKHSRFSPSSTLTSSQALPTDTFQPGPKTGLDAELGPLLSRGHSFLPGLDPKYYARSNSFEGIALTGGKTVCLATNLIACTSACTKMAIEQAKEDVCHWHIAGYNMGKSHVYSFPGVWSTCRHSLLDNVVH